MSGKESGARVFMLALLGVAVGSAAATAEIPLTQAFTYQGQLQLSGSPYTGSADLRFSLWPDSTGGTQVGSNVTVSNVNIVNGTGSSPSC